ncbi:MAG: TolC family protein [Planctomycetota bacterium]
MVGVWRSSRSVFFLLASSLALILAGGCAAKGGQARFDESGLFPEKSGAPVTSLARGAATGGSARTAAAGAKVLRLELATIMTAAGASDLEIEKARIWVRKLDHHLELAEARFFPDLRPGISFRVRNGQYIDTRGAFVDVNRQETIAGLRSVLRLPLGEALYGLDEAKTRRRGGKDYLETVKRERVLKAVIGYFDLLAAAQEIAIADEALAFAAGLLAYHESRRRAGVGLEADVASARAEREAANMEKARSELGFREASLRLSTQLRMNPRVVLYPAEERAELLASPEANGSVEDLVKRALASNPSLKVARNELAAADIRVAAAENAWKIPNVVFEALLDERGEHPGRFGGTGEFFAGLEWKLDVGIGARKRSAAADRDRAAVDFAGAREHLVAAVIGLHDKTRLSRRLVEASAVRIRAAESVLELAQSKMRNGAGLLVEVLDARLHLTEARLARLRAVTEHNQSQVTLQVLAGQSLQGAGRMSK